MRRMLSIMFLTVFFNGCGGTTTDIGTPTSTSTQTPAAVTPSDESVELTVPRQSNGTSLEEWVSRLTTNGVVVRAVSCGNTGNAYIQVAGGYDGSIWIVEVPSSQAPTASTIGFDPLSRYPEAYKVPC